MNKRCYRIIFNTSRGQRMAVAEIACAHAGGTPGQTRARRIAKLAGQAWQDMALSKLRTLVLAMVAGLGLVVPLQAQIIADASAPPTQRPTILSDGTRPLINIQTPSSAGVSRNTYSQFDVQTNGAILNNARTSNPWLATGEARVILNEVNSSNPSYLRGAVTVNGASAQVVIANPSGLKIDGASFVNANRVTLTTGTPVVDSDGLKAIRVERGAVEIYGGGLNVQLVPFTEILSRAATLTAQVRAGATGEISITTGAQTVDYASGQTTAISPSAPAPAIAIDASALGSMYAGRITLLATEAGVGVRNAGALQAASQLILTADGQLSNTGSMSAPVVSLGTVTGDIVQSGQLQATNAALVSAGGNLTISGQGLVQTAGSAVVLSAQKGIALESNAGVGSTATGGQVTLSARAAVQLGSGSSVSGQAGVTITSDTQVQGAGTQLSSSGGSVNLIAGSGVALSNSRIDAASIQIETGAAFATTNAPINLTANTLNASGNLTVLATGSVNSSANSLSAGGHLHMGSAQTLTTQNDVLRASSVEMIGSRITANSLDAAASTGSLKISSSAGSVDLVGTNSKALTLAAATDLTITALGGDARLTAVQATADNIKVNATGDTRFIEPYGKGTSQVRPSSLIARKGISLATVGTGKVLDLANSNLQASTEDLRLTSAGSIAMGATQVKATQGSISAVSGGTISGVGIATLQAGQNLSIDAGQGNLVITPAQTRYLSAGQDLSLTARTGLLKLDGAGGSTATGASRVVMTARDLNLQGASVDIQAASLSASRDLRIAATDGNVNIAALENKVVENGYDNRYLQGAQFSAGRSLQILSAGDIAAQGLKATAGGDLLMQAGKSMRLTGTTNDVTSVISADGYWTANERRVSSGTLNAGTTVALIAGTDLLMEAIQARAAGDMTITALGNVRLDVLQGRRELTETVELSSDDGKFTNYVQHSRGTTTTIALSELSGASVNVTAGKDLTALATKVSSAQDLSLTARTGLLKLDGSGSNTATGATRASMTARDMTLKGAAVDIEGASLTASRDVAITATNGSVYIAALENTVSEGDYSNRYMQGAQINAGRTLQIDSAGDITSQGLSASAGSDMRIQAVGSLKMTGTSNRTTSSDGFWTTNQRIVNPGTLTAGTAMALSAGTDLLMDAVQARAGGALTIDAVGNVRLDASQHWRESTATNVDNGKGSTTVTHYLRESITTAPTELSAASVSVSAGNDLSTYGTKVASSGRVSLRAGGAANYYAVYDQTNNRDDSSTSHSFFGIQYSSSNSTSSRAENIPLVTRLQSQAELVSNSGGDTLLQGTKVSAGGGYAINAGVGDKARADARIILEGVKTTVQQSRTASSNAVVWQSTSDAGSVNQTLALPTFAGGGTFSAPGGLSVQIPDGDFKSQIQTLSQQPGMGYLNDLAARKDVNWQPIKLAHEQWNYSQEGLTPAGAALLGVAVAWATGGMGANLVGGTVSTTVGGVTTVTTTTAGMLANAAFTSLASQASITLVNNKGDIAKTLKDMSNSSTIKATLAAVLTAGVLDKLASTGTMKDLSELSKNGGFSDKLTFNLINATGRAMTTTAINGGNLEDALKSALVGGLVDTAQGQAASFIGANVSDYLAHKLAHALVGCVAGAAAGGACKDGAIGGAIGEVVGQMFKPANGMFYTEAEKDKVLAYSKMVAGAVSAYAGGDAQTAITTSEVAVRNNLFFVPPLVALLAGAAGYTTAAGGGNPVAGLQAVGQGNDPLSRALAYGTQTAVALSMDAYPKETAATLSFLNWAGGNVGEMVNATVTYVDDKTGRVVSTQWNSLSPDTRDALIGAGKVTSVVLSAAKVVALRSTFLEAPPSVGKVASALSQQQAKNAELIALFDKTNPSNSVTLGKTSYSALPSPESNMIGTTKTFDTAALSDATLQKEVFDYAQKLAGGGALTPTTKAGVWNVELGDGTKINVRNFSSSGVGRWTIDINQNPALSSLTKKNAYEVKFK